jgi:hypothetical protein
VVVQGFQEFQEPKEFRGLKVPLILLKDLQEPKGQQDLQEPKGLKEPHKEPKVFREPKEVKGLKVLLVLPQELKER